MVEQAALADFIEQGHFSRHVKRMRVLYSERAETLAVEAKRILFGVADVSAVEGGLHTIAWLRDGIDEMEASTRAARLGVEARALSVYRLREQCPPGLVLGFGAVNRLAIKEGLERLATALRPANS